MLMATPGHMSIMMAPQYMQPVPSAAAAVPTSAYYEAAPPSGHFVPMQYMQQPGVPPGAIMMMVAPQSSGALQQMVPVHMAGGMQPMMLMQAPMMPAPPDGVTQAAAAAAAGPAAVAPAAAIDPAAAAHPPSGSSAHSAAAMALSQCACSMEDAASVSAPQQLPRSQTSVRRRATKGKHGWTREEDTKIVQYVQLTGQKWAVIAALLPGRTDDAVRNRYLRLQKKTRSGEVLDATAVMTSQDLIECESSKKGDMWTDQEDARIMDAVARYGQKWQTISECLPGRSANAVRNRFLRCCSQSQETRRSTIEDLANTATGALVAAAASCQQLPEGTPSHDGSIEEDREDA